MVQGSLLNGQKEHQDEPEDLEVVVVRIVMIEEAVVQVHMTNATNADAWDIGQEIVLMIATMAIDEEGVAAVVAEEEVAVDHVTDVDAAGLTLEKEDIAVDHAHIADLGAGHVMQNVGSSLPLAADRGLTVQTDHLNVIMGYKNLHGDLSILVVGLEVTSSIQVHIICF